tara:strand:- start:1576 stop:2118 length:543 start_codon:yes stop_codon:yes gene_type:complete
MGQYYKIMNKTKKEYLTPHTFGNGAKLMEFVSDGKGILQGLAILLANGNGRGGGDHDSDNNLVGSWSGDQITVEGDYADDTLWDQIESLDYKGNPNPNYVKGWKDISKETFKCLLEDEWLRQTCKDHIRDYGIKYMNPGELDVIKEVLPKEVEDAINQEKLLSDAKKRLIKLKDAKKNNF